MNMTTKQIQALGYFLAFYTTDLSYIDNFQKYKTSPTNPNYSTKEIGSFYAFLVEFRVIRNISTGATKQILEQTINWVNGSNPDDVDAFAEILLKTGLTHNKTPTSMASKILFLNNPWKIIPMDSLARKTLKQKENIYHMYLKRLENYTNENQLVLEKYEEITNDLVNIIHNDYAGLKDLNIISKNRMLDKLLWASGK